MACGAKLLALCLVLVARPVAAERKRSSATVTPVQKVIQLLEGMAQKGKKEKHDEEVQYKAYKMFCGDTTREKTRSIKDYNQKIAKLKADIEKYVADAELLTKEIAIHDGDISCWTGDEKAATNVRAIEKSDYDNLHKDYSESIDALQRAIAVLKEQAHDRKQAGSFTQLSALKQYTLIPQAAKKTIETFLAQDPDDDITAPEAEGYEFQSHGIIEMLEELFDKFQTERTSLEKQEMNSKHAYDILMQDLAAQLEQANADRTEKSEVKAKKLEAKAGAEGDIEDTTIIRDDDQKYLDDLVATCDQKANDFVSRQQLRTEELEAIEKAIEIISSGAVKGNSEKYLPSMLQQAQKPNTAFAVLSSEQETRNAQTKAAVYLNKMANELGSRVLSSVASKVSADPFAKVKKMIKDLLVRLMEEANEEAEHKGWCDQELATNEQTRKEKTEKVEILHAEIDQLEAAIAKLTEEMTELNEAVAELDKAMAKATEVRNEEKATNTQTISDSQEAQTAVAQALTVLKEFYEKAGDATALVQQPAHQPEAPEVFDAPYKGMQSENGGVIGMLEVIESDFARLEADTKAAEASAAKEYETFMSDSKTDKEAKIEDIEHKTAKKQDENQALVVKKEDLEGTQKELDASLAYFDKLKPSCVDAGVSYEDRVARRKAEIESLQQALKILNGEDIE